MSTLPRFDSIDLGTASVPADAAERFAALAAQAGTGEPWTTPEQIPVGTLFTEAVYQDLSCMQTTDVTQSCLLVIDLMSVPNQILSFDYQMVTMQLLSTKTERIEYMNQILCK